MSPDAPHQSVDAIANNRFSPVCVDVGVCRRILLFIFYFSNKRIATLNEAGSLLVFPVSDSFV